MYVPCGECISVGITNCKNVNCAFSNALNELKSIYGPNYIRKFTNIQQEEVKNMTIRDFISLFLDMFGKPEMECDDFKKFFKEVLDSEITTDGFSKLFTSIDNAAAAMNLGTATVEALVKINNITTVKFKGVNYIPLGAIEEKTTKEKKVYENK